MRKYVTTHNNASKLEKWSRVVYEVVVAEDGQSSLVSVVNLSTLGCYAATCSGNGCISLGGNTTETHNEELDERCILPVALHPFEMAPSVFESAASGTTGGTNGVDAGAGKEFQLTDGSSFGSATSAWSTNLLAVDDNQDDEEEPNQEKLLNVEMEDKGTDSSLKESFSDHDPAAVAASAYYGGESDEDHGSGVICVAG